MLPHRVMVMGYACSAVAGRGDSYMARLEVINRELKGEGKYGNRP